MPFGIKRTVGSMAQEGHAEKPPGVRIDFDSVYKKLLEPALRQAGCDPFRADSEATAGDIRTDMFFELVTADLVVADISIANENVFYELGVRHGICPHGVLSVQGNFVGLRPFDVAPDRCFSYNGALFLASKASHLAHEKKELDLAVEHLSRTFKLALAGERETMGSPVYEHLPGLIPVNWEKIQTSKANYFGALRDDWLDRVRMAQSLGHPGDIKTLADDAPTLLHRTKILFEAASALIDLCRYQAAERQLREVIEHDPNHFEAQLQLGRVLANQGKTDQAERHLRNVLHEHENDPYAADLLGQISRHLWHLSWRDEPQETRQKKAIETSHLAAQAVRGFVRAQQFDARAYFAGFNALILITVLDDLRKSTGATPAEIWPANLDVQELMIVVQFCAKNSRERALENGDSVEQFWTTTTLSGIALIQNDEEKALQRIREACSIPGATSFQLNAFQERLLLIDELDFRPSFVKPALVLVRLALKQKDRRCTCERVFLWAGYPVDKDTYLKQRFPESSIDSVQQRIEKALSEWNVGKDDLAICEGVHEGDILFAEACRKRGARVRLMLLEPVNGKFHQAFWPFRSEKWEQRFHELRSALGEDVWFHSEHLGSALDVTTPEGRRSVQRRHKNWLINTAAFEAEPASDRLSEASPDFTGRLYGLFLWNGEGEGENPEDPSYFIRLVDKFNGYQGQVKIISAVPAPVVGS